MDGVLPAPAASALGLKPAVLDDSYLIKEGNTLAESGRARAEKAMADKKTALEPIKEKFTKVAAEQQALKPPPETVLPTLQHKGMSPKELNDSVSILFTLAALGGAMTRHPMTAALNAFSAGLKGLHEGDQEVFKREAETFDRQLKLATEKSREAGDRYRSIIEKGKGDLQSIENELRLAALEFNDTVTLATVDMKSGKDMVAAGIALHKQAQEAEKTREMFKMQARKIDETHRNNVARTDAMAAHEANMRSLAEHKQATGKLTESEAKSTTNWNEMHFANDSMTKLSAEGITNIPISAQMLGRLYNPETGGWFASVQQEIRNSMTSKEEQRAFDAALAYTLAQAHAQGGARPSAYQVQMIWNAYIPMAGEDPETQLFKAELRANALESVKVSAGQGVARLEASRGQGGATHQEGEKSKSKSGRPIVFRGGQWHYEDAAQ